MSVTALLWDIDGTLLHTARAGIYALEDAAAEVLGEKPDLADLPTAGLTDVEIARTIVRRIHRREAPELAERLLRAYERHLPGALPRRQGCLLPNVREILEEARRRQDVVSFLLTGNTRAGARAKLTHYGLEEFFADGAFADDSEDRPSIAREALRLLRRRSPDLALERIFVIGDTPHDIHCGKAIGARTIAVATGNYSEEELLQHAPWWTIAALPTWEKFWERLVLQPV